MCRYKPLDLDRWDILLSWWGILAAKIPLTSTCLMLSSTCTYVHTLPLAQIHAGTPWDFLLKSWHPNTRSLMLNAQQIFSLSHTHTPRGHVQWPLDKRLELMGYQNKLPYRVDIHTQGCFLWTPHAYLLSQWAAKECNKWKISALPSWVGIHTRQPKLLFSHCQIWIWFQCTCVHHDGWSYTPYFSQV